VMKAPRKKPASAKSYRTRHEPPTLDEAVFAAQGMSDVLSEQVEIVAMLMGVSHDEASRRVMQNSRPQRTIARTVLSRRTGTERTVVVERKPTRRITMPQRLGGEFS
jgi:hypothetical protein